MNDITLEQLIDNIKTYNPDAVEKVKKAYYYAETHHKGQFRQSGEEYIIHPLNVAYILSEMHADEATLCAGLLHDIVEDTDVTLEDVAHEFNTSVARLVDGVTKISKMNFSSKDDENYANTRKIITSITEDVRIIIVKLADRLHNMRTLEYKSKFKQKENAIETMEIYVPLAYKMGIYRIKSELEDLSFKYIKPGLYEELAQKKEIIDKSSIDMLLEMKYKISTILAAEGIPNEIKIRTKNIYGIYSRLQEGYKLSTIHDLRSLKIMVDSIYNCYIGLCLVHRTYKPINAKFKDYISNPKTNGYSSLHTTVFANDNKLVQMQIRTFDMDKVASFGLPTLWDIEKGNARIEMQKELKNKYQFYKSLVEIDKAFEDNKEFVKEVKKDLFSERVYIHLSNGDRVELPKGSTIIDLAYTLGKDVGNNLSGAIVNDEPVNIDYVLNNKDRVYLLTDVMAYGPKQGLEDKAHMQLVKKKIIESKTDWS